MENNTGNRNQVKANFVSELFYKIGLRLIKLSYKIRYVNCTKLKIYVNANKTLMVYTIIDGETIDITAQEFLKKGYSLYLNEHQKDELLYSLSPYLYSDTINYNIHINKDNIIVTNKDKLAFETNNINDLISKKEIISNLNYDDYLKVLKLYKNSKTIIRG